MADICAIEIRAPENLVFCLKSSVISGTSVSYGTVDHGVDDIKDQIGQQVVPETHVPYPHQRVAENAGNTEQDEELTTAKTLAQPGGAKVIG